MKETLTTRQEWVLKYLKSKETTIGFQFVSPSEIGKAWRKANGVDKSWYDSSDYSGLASPICKALVAKGLALRNERGHYKFLQSGPLDIQETNPDFAKSVNPKIPAIVENSTYGVHASVSDTESARIAYNASNGYILVANLGHGNDIYKKKNPDGITWSYFSQKGQVFNQIWNEMIATKEEFIAIAKDLYSMGYQVIVTEIESTNFKYDIGQLVFYIKDNLIHAAKVISRSHSEITGSAVYETVHGIFDETRVFASKAQLISTL